MEFTVHGVGSGAEIVKRLFLSSLQSEYENLRLYTEHRVFDDDEDSNVYSFENIWLKSLNNTNEIYLLQASASGDDKLQNIINQILNIGEEILRDKCIVRILSKFNFGEYEDLTAPNGPLNKITNCLKEKTNPESIFVGHAINLNNKEPSKDLHETIVLITKIPTI